MESANKLDRVYIDIEVIHLEDQIHSEEDILSNILVFDEYITPESIKKEGKNIGRRYFEDCDKFNEFFSREFKSLEKVIQSFDMFEEVVEKALEKTKTEISRLDKQSIYLIVKYKMPREMKKVIRNKFQFLNWFADKFAVLWWWEETVDGFLIFFKRRVDFTHSLHDKINFEELKDWLDFKGIYLPKILWDKFEKIFN